MCRRLVPILDHVLTPLSTILLLAILGIWLRSHWRFDVVESSSGILIKNSGTENYLLNLSSRSARVCFFYLHTRAEWGGIRNVAARGFHHSSGPTTARTRGSLGENRFGFRWDADLRRLAANGYHRLIVIVLPTWLLGVLASLLPAR